MNAISVLAGQHWVERLGLTLLHFLWQGAVIASVYGILRSWLARRLGPNGRYTLACAALAMMAVAPGVTWLLRPGTDQPGAALTFDAPMSAVHSGAARAEIASTIPMILLTQQAPSKQFLFWVVALWLTGASAFFLRLAGGSVRAASLRHRMVRPAPAEWQQTLQRLKTSLAISRPVCFAVSGLVEIPAVIGWLRPMVLVPAGALTGLPPAQLRAILLHELAHIRRHDYLVNLLQSTFEALFFYHPAVWWVSGHMRAEREHCCDDIAVSVTGDRIDYVRALAELACAGSQPSGVLTSNIVAANGGSVAGRIARLLGQSSQPHRAPGAALPALLLLGMGAWVVFGQSASQFEVASVKPSSSQGIMNVRPVPGRLTADASVQILMQYAYGVQPYQVVGGPGWIQTQRFQIDAKADATASRDRMLLMLQALLEDRFRLKVHRETRDQPVFALEANRGGVKLLPAKQESCQTSALDAASEWTGGGRMASPGELPPASPRCGSASLALGPAGARLSGENVAMPELSRALSMLLGRGVIDRTGFAGPFNLKLDFVPDDSTPSVPAPPPGSGISGDSLAAALQQQLGLHLASTRGPVQVIVVDAAERPSAN